MPNLVKLIATLKVIDALLFEVDADNPNLNEGIEMFDMFEAVRQARAIIKAALS